MKKLLLLLLIAPVLSYGQDYLDEMALDACLCIEEDIINRKKPLKKEAQNIGKSAKMGSSENSTFDPWGPRGEVLLATWVQRCPTKGQGHQK